METQTIDETNIQFHERGFVGGFYIRPMRIARGDKETHDGHAHWIDHVSNVLTPVGIKWRNIDTGAEGITICKVPCKVNIPARVWHEFFLLDGTDVAEWECWFSAAEAEAKYEHPVPYHLEREIAGNG